MTITHELTLDLKHKGELAHIEVVQGDAFTRQVDLMLQCGGEDWTIPVCDPVVRYCKPDGTGGIYDTLPDGQPAIVYAGNVLTLALAPQMLTCSGPVQVQVELNTQEKRLATFTFLVVVEPGVAPNRESEDYVNWSKAFLLQSTGAKAGQYLKISNVDDTGRILALTAADVPVDDALSLANEALLVANNVAHEITAYSPSGTRSIAESASRTAGEAMHSAETAIQTVGQALDAINELKQSTQIALQNQDTRIGQMLPKPSAAALGQYLQVSQVDSQGNVLALTAADMSSTGSNLHFFKREFTLSEEVNGITMELPAPLTSMIMYDCVIKRPDTSSNTTPFTLYSIHGGSYTRHGEIALSGSLHFSGYRYADVLGIGLSHRADQHYSAAKPVIGENMDVTSIKEGQNSITYYAKENNNVFPAGTKVWFWEVYCE